MDNSSEQIGDLLRNARENAGLSVEDASFRTRLPHSAIEALEADNFSHFVSPVYAKSFLSQYSAFLGVDAGPWLDALRPSAFVEGNPLLPLFDSGGPMTALPMVRAESGEAWRSAFVMLSVTAVLVYASIRIFEFYEKRFGNEISTEQAAEWKQEIPHFAPKNAVTTPPKAMPLGLPVENAEEVFQAPRRAIIVREWKDRGVTESKGGSQP